MTPRRPAPFRLFPAAALIAGLGLPMTACAQNPEAVEAAEAVEPEAEVKLAVEGEDAAPAAEDKQADESKKAQKPKKKEKTPEELAAEKDQKELKELKLAAQLGAARLAAELAPLKEEKSKIEAELALLNAKQQDTQAKAKLKKQQADFKAALELAEMKRELTKMQQQFQQMQTKTQIESLKRQADMSELSAANAKLAAEASAIQAELTLMRAKRVSASIDKDEMQYPQKPLKNGVLTISDRRIPLNGGISRGSADYVTERIHYYNNLSETAPIFIVIDTNPGGSVMEGYRIVTAMQNSKAPVHVVVKSYAASMAAVITTLAVESYAYPNAIILHHQMSSGMRGNLTQQKEWLEEGFEWAKRLADPVAEKMGIDYDEFTEQMYENNSDGDWAEFADQAKKLKWVNHVVEEIRETALVTAPVDPSAMRLMLPVAQADTPETTAPRAFTQHELFNNPPAYEVKQDGNGNTYYELPPLSPYDFYFLHDPDGRYQIAK